MIKQLKKLIPPSLKYQLRTWLIGHDIHTYYFAQSGEDISLHALFTDILQTDIARYAGYYIDIGAYDPVKFSNTYFFYLNGWRGINVDPRPGSKVLFDKARPRDLNLELGISATEAPLTYFIIGEDSTLNTFSRAYLDAHNLWPHVRREVPVETMRLSTLLEKFLPAEQPVDLLNIDTEGMDLEILRSNDWSRLRPKVISVEISPALGLKEMLEHETSRFLAEQGYLAVGNNFIIRNTVTGIFVDCSLLQ